MADPSVEFGLFPAVDPIGSPYLILVDPGCGSWLQVVALCGSHLIPFVDPSEFKILIPVDPRYESCWIP